MKIIFHTKKAKHKEKKEHSHEYVCGIHLVLCIVESTLQATG